MAGIYQLKVTLLGTDPPIWRRILVPAELTLAKLHDVLQRAMGWQNSHLYDFRAGKQIYGRPDRGMMSFGSGPTTINDRQVRLDEVLPLVRSKLIYTYDMGDSWEHSVVVEKILTADPTAAYPLCIGGERACPPEDCGGVPGFYRLLDNRAELIAWIGEDYDPDAFPVEAVNRALRPRRRSGSNRPGGRSPSPPPA